MEGGDDTDLKILDHEESENQESSKRKYNNNNKKSSEKNETDSESGAYSDYEDDGNNNDKDKQKNKIKKIEKSKSLHRTTSIFLPSLPSSVTKEELEDIFKEINVFNSGFKRIALSDPAPERGFYKRGWVTFESNVNVKDICWALNNHKIRGSNVGAMVNRDLNKRVRPSSSFVCHHKPCVRNDIKIATKIIENMDKRWNLWIEDEKKMNPLLENIADYLVDEMSAEEDELLASTDSKSSTAEPIAKKESIPIDIDIEYKKVLDRLILYLRVVHSFDFYNCIEYQQEDSMPNRCGIIHARAPLTPNEDGVVLIKTEELNSYISNFESNMKPYIEYKDKLDEEAARKLGLKDKDIEIEKFVETNSQELAPDRWLCPLSGKKFKGAEFIRKHLFYKHDDKINEVKKEVDYFNNYLIDPKRPQLPEHPINRLNPTVNQPALLNSPTLQQASNISAAISKMNIPPNQPLSGYGIPPNMYYGATGNRPSHGWQQQQQQNMPQYYGNGSSNRMSNPNMNPSYGGGGGYNRNLGNNNNINSGYSGASRRPREIIHYKDLDAPDE
jgi:hypothetical protein